MVEIRYIDGSNETAETYKNEKYHTGYIYDTESQMFIVFTSPNTDYNMKIPREFVKSIRYIEVEDK